MAHPPEPPRRSGGGNRWFLACGVGCGALVLLVFLGGIAIFLMLRSGMSEIASEVQGEMVAEYERLQSQDLIPEEHAAVFDRLYAISQREDASPSAIIASFTVVLGFLEDGEVTQPEADAAGKIADFLEANPSVGFWKLMTFLGEDPEFQDTIRELERTFQNYEPATSPPDYSEPEVEDAPAEPEVESEPAPL